MLTPYEASGSVPSPTALTQFIGKFHLSYQVDMNGAEGEGGTYKNLDRDTSVNSGGRG